MSKFQVCIIKNDINDKVYIGQTTQSLSARFNGHCGHAESRIGRAMKDIGKHHFSISLLDDTATSLEELLEKERYYIKKYNSIENGYNSTMQATGGKISSRKPYATYLDNKVYDMLKKYSSETSIPISKILDKAIIAYLESVKNED